MDDYISRLAAIMDAESWVAADEYEKNLQKKVVEWLKEFPPAELGTDTIIRQAAIDVFYELWGTSLTRTVDAIKQLPPAQPETATVTIGRTKGSVTMWYECDACGEPVDQKDNYCRNCGRKLKHE